MNTLRSDATGRRKQDIDAIRHIYLDVDHDGDRALSRILSDPLLPKPSYVLGTSPGKHQIVWKADGFDMNEAEQLQKAMAIRYGADRAATDATRVLRIPGLMNRKYDPPCLVSARKLSGIVCHPSDFHIARDIAYISEARAEKPHRNHQQQPNRSQSELDWAETCRRLEQGENPSMVRNWLEQSRPDKSNPKYYAELTVRKAVERLQYRNPSGFDHSM